MPKVKLLTYPVMKQHVYFLKNLNEIYPEKSFFFSFTNQSVDILQTLNRLMFSVKVLVSPFSQYQVKIHYISLRILQNHLHLFSMIQ